MCKSFAFVLSASLLLIGCSSALERQLQFFKQTRDDQAARELLELTVSQQPGNSEALYLLGKFYFEHDEYPQGHEVFDACRSASTRYESEIDYQFLIHLNSAFASGNVALAALDYTEAIKQYTYASEIDTMSVAAHLGFAQALHRSDDTEGAIEAYRRVEKLDPENGEALDNLSELLLRGKFYSESLLVSQQLLRFHNESHGRRAQERLVYAHLALQDYVKAEEVFYRMSFIEPQLLSDFSVALYNAGRHEEALRPLTRLSQGTDPEGLYSILLGECYYELGEYRDMADMFERLTRRFPTNRNVRTSLIIAFELLGYKDRARSQREILKALTEELE